jgi:DNA-binding NtrC family response regulator
LPEWQRQDCQSGIKLKIARVATSAFSVASSSESVGYKATFFFGITPAEANPETMNNIRNKSILLIDDDARMLRALEKVLTGAGAVITCVNWAGDAIDILTKRQKRIDLVMTDLRMPFVTGLTVVYAIHEVFPDLPVIVLTALSSPEVKAECIREGAAAFLEKPLNTAQVLGVVATVFAKREAAEAGLDKGKETPESIEQENACER